MTEAGRKARAAPNGTRHGLRGGEFALLPGEDADEFASCTRRWPPIGRPRDAYERRWAEELVAALWRQGRPRGWSGGAGRGRAGEPADRGDDAPAPHLRPLWGPDRQGHGRALRALRTLRDRPAARIAEAQECTSEPDQTSPEPAMATSPARTPEPEPAPPEPRNATPPARTPEPERPTLSASPAPPIRPHP